MKKFIKNHQNFKSIKSLVKKGFGILLAFTLISCQHYPSNVEIIYKSPSGPGYKNTGSNAITGIKGGSFQSNSKQEIEELKPLKEQEGDAISTTNSVKNAASENTQKEVAPIVASASILPNAKPLEVVSVAKVQNHKVLPGETYYSIARTYGVSPKEIMQENNYKQGDVLKVGSVVKIPKGEPNALSSSGNLASQVSAHSVKNPAVLAAPQNSSVVFEKAPTSAVNLPIKQPEAAKIVSPPVMPSAGTSSCGERFIQPILAKDILLKFGEKISGGVKNDGVIYKISSSWPVKAANNGEVAYVGDGFSDYGNIVILKHNKGYFSIYGHLMPNSLKKGQVVMRGDVISKTSPSDGKFYFSIRKGKVPIDPSKCF